jgi:MFS family permease
METTAPYQIEKPEPTRVFRWVVLIMISLAMFGNYYIYDCISVLADVLKAQLNFSDSNIGLLNAIYSVPNIFMVLIGGIIIDYIGTKKATFLFSGLCLIGAIVTAVTGILEVMAVGRLIFGIGAESLIVAVTTAIAKWFKGKELSFAFGVNLTIARLGSFTALNSPTVIGDLYQNWQYPLFVSVGFGVICVLGAVLYWIMESRAESRYTLGIKTQPDKIVFSDLKSFGISYWFIVAICVTFYSGIFPFQTFAVKYFIEAHSVSRELGGFLSSMLTAFAMIFTPLFGLMVDKIGKRSLFMMFGSMLLIPVYLILAFTKISLFVPMAMMGIAFSLIPAVMWPSVAYIVNEKKLGTAYGLMTLVQNIGLAGFNFLIGWANDYSGASVDNPAGYNLGLWIFSSLGFIGLLFAYLLRRRETGQYSHGLETIKVS